MLRDKLTQFKALLPDYDVVVLSDYAKGGLVNVADMITRRATAGKLVMVDPKGDDFSRYAGATMLTPNKAELQRIVGSLEKRGAADGARPSTCAPSWRWTPCW